MDWKCPKCGSEENAPDSIRCACGYGMTLPVNIPGNNEKHGTIPFKIRNIIIGIGVYLWIIFLLFNVLPALVIVFVIYSMLCMLSTRQVIRGAESRLKESVVEFNQNGALDQIGIVWGSFHHIFHSPSIVTSELCAAIESDLVGKLGCTSFTSIQLRDVDRDLKTPENRMYLRSNSACSIRGTKFYFVCAVNHTVNIQGIRWWILISGLRDPNKLFWRYASSPLLVPFILIPYIRRQYDPLSSLNSVPAGFFNSVDLMARTREIQYVAFEALVSTLESFGVDTNDLKQQKANILNVNVSGGQANLGSIVQGAFNKVSGAFGGAKS